MIDYQPFKYPPDHKLAALHQKCTMPGKIKAIGNSKLKLQQQSLKSTDILNAESCPCCKEPLKEPLTSWTTRSITEDFKYYGGAVVAYFWLVKLYAIITALVLIIYSGYLFVCTIKYCTEDDCKKFMFGIWVISNQGLYKIMQKAYENEKDTSIFVLFTLRSVAYVILIAGNTAAVYVVSRFKRRYPRTHGIQKFSLMFKNLPKEETTEKLFQKLQQDFPELKVEQIFQLKKMQPYYSLYARKLEIYYQCLIQQKPKAHKKLLKALKYLDKECEKHEQGYEQNADRAILVIESEQTRNHILNKYKKNSFIFTLKYLIGLEDSIPMYCDPCPIPEQIIWNNIGQHEQQKIKFKILSVVYFFALIGISYFILFFCLEIVYKDWFEQPWDFIATNIILFFMVYLALTFRQLMNRLSQMRYPNTQTSRTLFIVLTTVLFHFLFYLVIPTTYLGLAKEGDRNEVMVLITNQIFNFMLVQFILAGVDFVYCSWNKNKKIVEDVEKPVGCQKILHKRYQYPRFPIEFKLIILFKIFSFITLTAFQTPSLLFLIFAFLIFVYVYDKKAVYTHYRMEIIDNKVLYMFLKIYANFYSVYIFIAFAVTQHLEIQFWGGFGIMVVAIVIQLFLIREREMDEVSQKEELGITGMGNISSIYKKMREKEVSMISDYGQQHKESYKRRYDQFRANITDSSTDLQIKEFLVKNGLFSLKNEDSISRERLL